MYKLKQNMTGLLTASLLALILTACGESERKRDPDQKTTLILATSGDNPPFEFHDTKNGKDQITGADIDLAHALAQELGITLETRDTDFSSLIPTLQAHRADFAMALLTPTEERKKNVSFSDCYFISRLSLVTLKNRTIHHEEDLEGKKIGVQLGSNNERVAKELASKIKDLQIVSLNRLGELIQEVRTKRIDAVLVEVTPAKAYAEAHKDLNYNTLEEHQSNFAIAFPKDSPWIERFNQALKKLKSRGKIEEIMRKWLKE